MMKSNRKINTRKNGEVKKQNLITSMNVVFSQEIITNLLKNLDTSCSHVADLSDIYRWSWVKHCMLIVSAGHLPQF